MSEADFNYLNIDEVDQRLVVQEIPQGLTPGVWWTERSVGVGVPILGIIIGLLMIACGLGAHYGPRRVLGAIREDPSVYAVFLIGFTIYAGSVVKWPRWIPKAFVFAPDGLMVRPLVSYGFSDDLQYSWRYVVVGISAVACMALFLLERPGIGMLGAGPLLVFVILSVMGFFDVFDRWRRSQKLMHEQGSWMDVVEVEYSPASQWGWRGDTSNGQQPTEPYDVFLQMADGTRCLIVRTTEGREFASALTVALKNAGSKADDRSGGSFTAQDALAQARKDVENVRRRL